MGDGDHVGGVVEHDETRRTESAPGRPHRVVARRCVEQLDGQDRIGDAGDGGDDAPILAGATTDLLDDLADRRAHRQLRDTGPTGVAADRAHDGPRRVCRAERPEPVGAVDDDSRHIGERLDVVGQHEADTGRCVVVRIRPVGSGGGQALAIRRGSAREWLTSFDHLEQCGLLAEQVLARSDRDANVDITQPSGVGCFGDGVRHASPFTRERSLQRDDNVASVYRRRGDQGALQYAVRIASEQHPILERARFAFGTVHDDDRWGTAGDRGGHGLPLHAGRETGPAPAAQAGGLDLFGDADALEPACGIEGLATSRRNVVGEGIDRVFVEDAVDHRHGARMPDPPTGKPDRPRHQCGSEHQ